MHTAQLTGKVCDWCTHTTCARILRHVARAGFHKEREACILHCADSMQGGCWISSTPAVSSQPASQPRAPSRRPVCCSRTAQTGPYRQAPPLLYPCLHRLYLTRNVTRLSKCPCKVYAEVFSTSAWTALPDSACRRVGSSTPLSCPLPDQQTDCLSCLRPCIDHVLKLHLGTPDWEYDAA